MRQITLDGYPKGSNLLEPAQCLEVAEFIISESAKISRRLDLRLLVNSLEDRLQTEDFEAGCTWEDLVASRIRERASITEPVQSFQTRAQRKAQQLQIAREIVELGPSERLRSLGGEGAAARQQPGNNVSAAGRAGSGGRPNI